MATVLQAAQAATAARAVALSRVAEALVSDTSRVDAAKAAYDAGLAAELGKWPSWISFAETVGVKAADIKHTKEETGAFRAALDGIMDLVVRDAWQFQTIAKRVAEEKSLRASGKLPEADAVAREIQSARTRRTELANVIRYGAIVGRYILDRMAQEGELAGVHKATVWAGVFSACNRRAAAIREEGGVITSDDLYSAAAAVLDGARKPEATEDEKITKAIAGLWAAFKKVQGLHILADQEIRAMRNILNGNARTQEEATEAEAAVTPITHPSKTGKAAPAPKAAKAGKAAPAPKAGKAAASKPAKVEGKVASDPAKIAADVI